MKFRYFILFYVFFVSFISAQNYPAECKIVVRDEKGKPVHGVKIIVQDTNMSLDKTDSSGAVKFPQRGVVEKNIELRVEKDGWFIPFSDRTNIFVISEKQRKSKGFIEVLMREIKSKPRLRVAVLPFCLLSDSQNPYGLEEEGFTAVAHRVYAEIDSAKLQVVPLHNIARILERENILPHQLCSTAFVDKLAKKLDCDVIVHGDYKFPKNKNTCEVHVQIIPANETKSIIPYRTFQEINSAEKLGEMQTKLYQRILTNLGVESTQEEKDGMKIQSAGSQNPQAIVYNLNGTNFLEKAKAFGKQEDFQKAEQEFKKGKKIDRKFIGLLEGLMDTYKENGQVEKAEEMAQEISENLPNRKDISRWEIKLRAKAGRVNLMSLEELQQLPVYTLDSALQNPEKAENVWLSFSDSLKMRDLWKCKNLKYIRFFQIDPTKIPNVFLNLQSLQVIEFGEWYNDHQIDEAIENMSKSKNIHTITFLYQIIHFKQLPNFKSFSNLKHLKFYNIFFVRDKKMFVEFFNGLAHIQTLELPIMIAHKGIEKLWMLKNIQILNIGIFNQIPLEIGKLTNLEDLTLQLLQNEKYPSRQIPKEITKLQKLESITINGKISNLDKALTIFSKLPKLKKLVLTQNSFSSSEQERIRKLLPNCEISF